MNRALPARDHSNRSQTSFRQSGSRGLVLSAVRLVYRIALAQPDKEKPPRRNPGGQCKRLRFSSALDRVAALPVLALGGCHGQSHFLADGARQEPAYGMWLPAGGFHQLLRCYAARPFQQFQNLVGLATLAGALRFLSAFGRFLGWGGLLGRLGLLLRNVGALWRDTGLFGGFRLLARSLGR